MKHDITDVGGPFWQGLLQRKLLLQFDCATGRAQFYPRPWSLYGESGIEWREATGRGTIYALTLSRVGPPALEHLVPYPLALVQLEEGPRMLARVNAPYETLANGQPIEIDWESTGDGFPVFKPTETNP